MTTNALAVRPAAGYLAPPSQDEFQGMIYMAKQLAEAQGFVPAHFYKQPNKILAAMLFGRDLGITPTNALQHIIVIEGKATADAQLMGMLVRRAGHRLEDKTTDAASTVTITRGDDGTKHVFTFTIEDAARAGLVRNGSAWQKFPQAMLFARALSGCARKGAQDALMGCAYVPEEIGAEVQIIDGEAVVVASPIVGEIPAAQAAPETVRALEEASNGAAAKPDVTTGDGMAAAETVTAPPPVPVSASRRVGAGRSIGPAPRRTNVVTVGAEKPTTAPEVAPEPVSQPEPVSGQDDLLDDAPLADDGLGPQREMLRQSAADLAHVNAVVRNVAAALEGKPLEVVPPATPNEISDRGLAKRIDSDYPGRALGNLRAEEIQAVLERFEMSLAAKRKQMAERGIKE